MESSRHPALSKFDHGILVCVREILVRKQRKHKENLRQIYNNYHESNNSTININISVYRHDENNTLLLHIPLGLLYPRYRFDTLDRPIQPSCGRLYNKELLI